MGAGLGRLVPESGVQNRMKEWEFMVNPKAVVAAAGRGGSLEVGKQADVVICAVPDHRELFYHFGINHVRTVVKRGRVVVAPRSH